MRGGKSRSQHQRCGMRYGSQLQLFISPIYFHSHNAIWLVQFKEHCVNMQGNEAQKRRHTSFVTGRKERRDCILMNEWAISFS